MATKATTELTPTLIREAHGLSLQEAADSAGVSVDTLRALERGGSVTVKTLRAVSAVYGLTSDVLCRALEVAARGAA